MEDSRASHAADPSMFHETEDLSCYRAGTWSQLTDDSGTLSSIFYLLYTASES